MKRLFYLLAFFFSFGVVITSCFETDRDQPVNEVEQFNPDVRYADLTGTIKPDGVIVHSDARQINYNYDNLRAYGEAGFVKVPGVEHHTGYTHTTDVNEPADDDDPGNILYTIIAIISTALLSFFGGSFTKAFKVSKAIEQAAADGVITPNEVKKINEIINV